MVSRKEILESYREYREEVDVLLDERALFALAFVRYLGRTDMWELARHLGLSLEEAEKFCAKMEEAGFVSVAWRAGGAVKRVEVSQSGREYLALVFGEAAPARRLEPHLVETPMRRSVAAVRVPAPDARLLAARAREGDEEAFVLIFERYSRPVMSFIYDMVRDRGLAEDLTQETFLHVYRNLGSLRDETKLAEWLLGIAKNVTRQWRRHQPKEAPGLERLEVVPSQDREILATELAGVIQRALSYLEEDKRLVFKLRVLEQRSYEEIAQITGFSVPKLRADFNQVMAKIRRRIRDTSSA
jgi:RNA polymerase sigma-70 factor (ECF subfamily)